MTANRSFESMKEPAEIRTSDWSDASLAVDGLKHLVVPVNENTSAFVSRTTVMSRGRGQDINDPYRTCKDFLNQQAHRRMEGLKGRRHDSIREDISEGNEAHRQRRQR